MSALCDLTPFDSWLVKPSIKVCLWASGNEVNEDTITGDTTARNQDALIGVGICLAILTSPILVAISAIALPIIAFIHLGICIFEPKWSQLTGRALAQSVTGIFPVIGACALVAMFVAAHRTFRWS